MVLSGLSSSVLMLEHTVVCRDSQMWSLENSWSPMYSKADHLGFCTWRRGSTGMSKYLMVFHLSAITFTSRVCGFHATRQESTQVSCCIPSSAPRLLVQGKGSAAWHKHRGQSTAPEPKLMQRGSKRGFLLSPIFIPG